MTQYSGWMTERMGMLAGFSGKRYVHIEFEVGHNDHDSRQLEI